MGYFFFKSVNSNHLLSITDPVAWQSQRNSISFPRLEIPFHAVDRMP